VIVALGRPRLLPPQPGDPDGANGRPGGPAAAIALAARAHGSDVQLVGTLGDDPEGDAVVTGLGKAGIGHAALLRDPAARTPVLGKDRGPLPRLDVEDVDLALRYLPDQRVLVVAEPLSAAALARVGEAALFQQAALVVVTDAQTDVSALPSDATVFAAPDEDAPAFAQLVGRYAAALDRGEEPAAAFESARRHAGWDEAEA
jgi:pfkB family carbohydrate kinase